MNTSHFFALRRENDDQTTFASQDYVQPAQGREVESGSFGLVGDARVSHTGSEIPIRSTQVSREQAGAESETLTPVTIKQVQDAVSMGQEPVKINHVVMKQVMIVARVVGLEAQINRTSLMLDDCTSRIQAVYLTSSDQDVPQDYYADQRRASIKEGFWIRVIGVICYMDGCHKISIIRMRPVVHYNEIVFHRLETVKTSLMQSRAN